MKRCYLGAGLLAVLLLAGIWSTLWMEKHHDRLARDVHRATVLAQEGETGQAAALIQHAKQGWEENWGISASLADHEPMERVDELFDLLETYAAAEEYVAFTGCCSQLASELEAMAEASSLTWWNLL